MLHKAHVSLRKTLFGLGGLRWGMRGWALGLGGCHGLRRGVFGLARGCWACAGWVLGKWFLGFGVGQGGLAGWWVGF